MCPLHGNLTAMAVGPIPPRVTLRPSTQGCSTALYTPVENMSAQRNKLDKSCGLREKADSGAAKTRNLCTATKPPVGCHAIVRLSTGWLNEVPDPRRAKGKLYKLPYVLLFSILAVVTGGNSFRSVETFITAHRRRLNTAFGLR
jgi:hypothetical protein